MSPSPPPSAARPSAGGGGSGWISMPEPRPAGAAAGGSLRRQRPAARQQRRAQRSGSSGGRRGGQRGAGLRVASTSRPTIWSVRAAAGVTNAQGSIPWAPRSVSPAARAIRERPRTGAARSRDRAPAVERDPAAAQLAPAEVVDHRVGGHRPRALLGARRVPAEVGREQHVRPDRIGSSGSPPPAAPAPARRARRRRSRRRAAPSRERRLVDQAAARRAVDEHRAELHPRAAARRRSAPS